MGRTRYGRFNPRAKPVGLARVVELRGNAQAEGTLRQAPKLALGRVALLRSKPVSALANFVTRRATRYNQRILQRLYSDVD